VVALAVGNAPANYTIRFRPGDKLLFRVEYYEEDDVTPVDLSGETVTLTVKATGLVPDIILTSGSGLTITALSGRIDVELTSTQTGLLNNRTNKKYELRLSVADRDIMIGNFQEEPR
jgi:hypothetical protein